MLTSVQTFACVETVTWNEELPLPARAAWVQVRLVVPEQLHPFSLAGAALTSVVPGGIVSVTTTLPGVA